MRTKPVGKAKANAIALVLWVAVTLPLGLLLDQVFPDAWWVLSSLAGVLTGLFGAVAAYCVRDQLVKEDR